jgi:hypothetical protein
MAKIIRTKSKAHGGITSAVCSVGGCVKTIKSLGLCSAHYERQRKYGDPLISRTTPGEPLSYYRSSVLGHDGNECLIWPYGRHQQGYGILHYGGSAAFVHRLVCEQTHGESPSSIHEAAHSCGNGHLGCVNPNHLSWKTPAENTADKITHGTLARGERNGKSRLTQNDVRKIMSMKGRFSLDEVASRFGVKRPTIADIYAGRTWNWLPGHMGLQK